MYDPVIALFISADSVVPDLYDPQSLNRYAYCRNNPLKYVDPDGHVMAEALAVAKVAAGVITTKFGAYVVSYAFVKFAEKAATFKADEATKQSTSKSVNKALAITAKTSVISTTMALGASRAATLAGKGYAAAAALTPETVAIGVIGAAQQPQIAQTIDKIINLPETMQELPGKAKKGAKKALKVTEGLMNKISPENESNAGNKAGGVANGEASKDPDTD